MLLDFCLQNLTDLNNANCHRCNHRLYFASCGTRLPFSSFPFPSRLKSGLLSFSQVKKIRNQNSSTLRDLGHLVTVIIVSSLKTK